MKTFAWQIQNPARQFTVKSSLPVAARQHKRPSRSTALRITIAALVSAMATPVLAAAPLANVQPNALPANWQVLTGAANIVQHGNTLNINQTSNQAIVNFGSFNVGSAALVDIQQNNKASALLARVIGSDPSQIYGQIKANGALWLINPAGIMVGQNARIDVGGFIASTLNVRDSDFLAGRLTFDDTNTTASAVQNLGAITTTDGGSVYMIGARVENNGSIAAPNGEVLLAAGQTVQLVGTGTPGVAVEITGRAGQVTNLGQISAAAGRIGLAAGLIDNSGTLNASSVVKEGGRIFLRAAQNLTTTSTSKISADGSNGGDIVLYADNAAYIDGQVSAQANTVSGRGGFVETSGKKSLDVVNVPTVGRGGEWYIDPYDIEIIGSGGEVGTTGTNAITSTGFSAKIRASTIAAQLNNGTDVTITTGTGDPINDIEQGDITVSSAINKSAGGNAALTLNANNNIIINADITSSSGALNLNLNSNYQSDYSGDHAVLVSNASIDLHGGALHVSESGGTDNGTLNLGSNATLALHTAGSQIDAGAINVLNGALLDVSGATYAVNGALNNSGTVNIASGALHLQQGYHSGVFTVANGATLLMVNNQQLNAGINFTGSGRLEWSDNIFLGTDITLDQSGPSLALHDVTLNSFFHKTLATQGNTNVDGHALLSGSANWNNSGVLTVTDLGSIGSNSEGAFFHNQVGGVITTSGSSETVLYGAGGGTFSNAGTLIKTGSAAQTYANITATSGSAIRIESGALNLVGGNFNNTFAIQSGAALNLRDSTLGSAVDFSGAGQMNWDNYIALSGPVDIKASAPKLTMGPYAVIESIEDDPANTLTTRNSVEIANARVDLHDNLIWNNYGTVNLLGSVGGTLDVTTGSAAFNNYGQLILQAGSAVATHGADLHNTGTVGGSGTFALDGGTLFNDGLLTPGTSAGIGTIAIQGNYTQGSTGALTIKIGSAAIANNFDRLDIDGTSTLNGALNIAPLNNYTFAVGDSAAFITALGAGNNGTFSQVNSGVQATFTIAYPGQATDTRALVSSIATPPVIPPVTPPITPPTTPPITPPPTVQTTPPPILQSINVVDAVINKPLVTSAPVMAPPATTSNSSPTLTEDTQTVGGGAGNFGDDNASNKASDDKTKDGAKPETKADDKTRTDSKPTKPLPVCT